MNAIANGGRYRSGRPWRRPVRAARHRRRALEKAGNKNLILDVTAETVKETFANAVLVRRTAIKDGDRTFGYPVASVNLGVLCDHDEHLETALAAVFVLKYGSIIVMDKIGYAEALPLYGLRQNIFTDPQKPMKVAPGIYPINGATPDDPCALTVDFALTYFLVSGELERSKVPINLLITDASGMSVLTAWAAGKFSSSSVKKFFDEFDLANKINNRTLIIPGKVAVMKGEIQDKLPDWNVVVGTREAVELVKYLKDGEYKAAAEAAAASKKPAEAKKVCRRRCSSGLREDRCLHPRHQDPRRSRRTLQAERSRIPEVRHHRRAYPLHLPGHPRGNGNVQPRSHPRACRTADQGRRNVSGCQHRSCRVQRSGADDLGSQAAAGELQQRASGARYRQQEGHRSRHQGLQPHQRQAHRQLR